MLGCRRGTRRRLVSGGKRCTSIADVLASAAPEAAQHNCKVGRIDLVTAQRPPTPARSAASAAVVNAWFVSVRAVVTSALASASSASAACFSARRRQSALCVVKPASGVGGALLDLDEALRLAIGRRLEHRTPLLVGDLALVVAGDSGKAHVLHGLVGKVTLRSASVTRRRGTRSARHGIGRRDGTGRRNGAQIATVGGLKALHAAIGLLEPAQIALHGLEVVEAGGDVGDEFVVERRQAVEKEPWRGAQG